MAHVDLLCGPPLRVSRVFVLHPTQGEWMNSTETKELVERLTKNSMEVKTSEWKFLKNPF